MAMNMVPGVGEMGMLGRLGLAATTGAIGGRVAGEGTGKGALEGIAGQAVGELVGFPSKKRLYSTLAQNDYAGAVSDILGIPELKKLGRAGLNIVESIRGGGVADKIGADAQPVYDEIYNTVGKKPIFKLPTSIKGGEGSRMGTWEDVQNMLKKLGKQGWEGIDPKTGLTAYDARDLRGKISRRAATTLQSYDSELANKLRQVNERWTNYYALHDLTMNNEFRPDAGGFQRVPAQRALSKDAEKLRDRIGKQNFNRLEEGLFGGATRHAGYDVPPQTGQRPRLIMSTYGPRTYGTIPEREHQCGASAHSPQGAEGSWRVTGQRRGTDARGTIPKGAAIVMPSSEVMHKWKHHKLHSGSKHGRKVKSRKQAIAIMLSEKRKEAANGGRYPER